LAGIDNGVLPTTLSPANVNSMYTGQLEEMPFKSFGGLLWA